MYNLPSSVRTLCPHNISSRLLLVTDSLLGLRSSGFLRIVGAETQLCVPWGENGKLHLTWQASMISRLCSDCNDSSCGMSAVIAEKLWMRETVVLKYVNEMFLFFFPPPPDTFSDEPVARVPKMASGKISLARGIYCCPSLFCPTHSSVCIVKNVRVCVYIYTHLTPYRLCMNYRCYQITQQWNILHKSGAVRSVDWIFIIGAPVWRWLGQYATLDRPFYSLPF